MEFHDVTLTVYNATSDYHQYNILEFHHTTTEYHYARLSYPSIIPVTRFQFKGCLASLTEYTTGVEKVMGSECS